MAGGTHMIYTERLLETEENRERLEQLKLTLPGETSEVAAPFVAMRSSLGEGNPHPAFSAAERGDAIEMLACLEVGFDVNWQRPRFKDTVLHIAATRNAKGVARVLIESGKCDYLIRDGAGRLASEKAYLFGENPALARLILIKERKQAEAQGVQLTYRP